MSTAPLCKSSASRTDAPMLALSVPVVMTVASGAGIANL